jgi:hypothetical protein
MDSLDTMCDSNEIVGCGQLDRARDYREIGTLHSLILVSV